MILSTKAETLERIAPHLRQSKVMSLIYFNTGEWKNAEEVILQNICERFSNMPLAIRSSALNEDGALSSMAGAYESRLNVDSGNREALKLAISSVIQSYSGVNEDQILVQPMVQDISACGVITNYEINTGSPYYIINYDDLSGRADTITGGVGANKTVFVHRDFKAQMITSPRILRWVEFVQEIEGVVGNVPLDIEFAETKAGQIYLLQARRISVEHKWNENLKPLIAVSQKNIEAFINARSRPNPELLGDRTILGEMSDWNPAEIIGTSPRPLSAALYRYLITDHIWRDARGAMGYRNPKGEALMVQLGGRPFIDIRCSFNSFLPSDLDPQIGRKLVNMWLDRLASAPELHDKVEFEVAQTAYDFSFVEQMESRYAGKLSAQEVQEFKSSLLHLTDNLLSLDSSAPLKKYMSDVQKLTNLQVERSQTITPSEEPLNTLRRAKDLLDECKSLGTLPFSVVARLAFVAECFLRSLVHQQALTASRVAEFKSSLFTVTAQMSRDFSEVVSGQMS